MLIKRIISGFFLIFISILLIFLGKLPFTFEIAFISLLGVLELYNLFSLKGFNSFKLYGSISTLLIVFCASLKPDFLFNLLLILFLANIVIVTVNKIRYISSVIDLGITYLGYLYIGWLFSYLILVRDISDYFLIFNFKIEKGAVYVILFVLINASCDIGAYFIGKNFGKHKFCPQISPRKTIEGSLGGLFCSILVALFLGSYVKFDFFQNLLLGIVLGIGAQVGDLFESVLKREVGVKNSGEIIIGHGGILDRFDSYFFNSPLFYLFLKIFNIL